MKYKSKEEAQKDHVENYKSDGIERKKGSMYASDFYRVQWIIDSVPRKAKVLDVGCNGGTIGTRLTQLGCYVKGIDIVPFLVERAKKRGVYAEVGEAEDLSRYEDESFDVVICTEVLEHLYDPLPAMKEAYRVLKKGGVYIVTVPHPASIMAHEKGGGDFHQQTFSLEDIDTLFHQDFKRGDVTFVEIPYKEEYCRANRIDPKRPQWIGLVARKG